MQVCKYASMQVCSYAGMQVCKYANMQVCNIKLKLVCQFLKTQSFRQIVNQALNPKASFIKVVQLGMLFANV